MFQQPAAAIVKSISACVGPWMVARGRGALNEHDDRVPRVHHLEPDAFADEGVRRSCSGHRQPHFLDFHNVPMISVMRRFGTEQVHVIFVKDQSALTEDDVTMDRRDAERILVVNLQQSCFRLCQNSESVPGAAQEN